MAVVHELSPTSILFISVVVNFGPILNLFHSMISQFPQICFEIPFIIVSFCFPDISIYIVSSNLILKQEFRDSLRLRYSMPLSDLPSKCVCGEKYTFYHALSCKMGGFVAQRHDSVRNLLTSLIGTVCTNVEVESQLQPLDNERFNLRTAVTSPEARLDFWSRGVTAFFDVREKKHPHAIFKEQEEEKNWKYQQSAGL